MAQHRLPPMHTVERDNYEAKRKRDKVCPGCGNRKFTGAPKCIACTYPERVAAMRALNDPKVKP